MKAIVLLISLLLLGCTSANETAAIEPKAAAPAKTVPPPSAPQPETARRVPEDLLTSNGVYYGCSVPADCEIKNVGNCCGYYPACVNKDSPTFPEKVKADCAAGGMSSICGFPSISACDCMEGRCTAISGPAAETAQPLE